MFPCNYLWNLLEYVQLDLQSQVQQTTNVLLMKKYIFFKCIYFTFYYIFHILNNKWLRLPEINMHQEVICDKSMA